MKATEMAVETGAAGAAFAIKAAGIKASFGMAGAAVLYMMMPPERPDGTFNRREFAARLAVAGLCSLLLGDWVVDVLNGLTPWLKAGAHPHPFWVASGAPGWWVSRWVALWIYKRRDKDIGEVADDIKKEVHP